MPNAGRRRRGQSRLSRRSQTFPRAKLPPAHGMSHLLAARSHIGSSFSERSAQPPHPKIWCGHMLGESGSVNFCRLQGCHLRWRSMLAPVCSCLQAERRGDLLCERPDLPLKISACLI